MMATHDIANRIAPRPSGRGPIACGLSRAQQDFI
jgi:hypothetical protein